MRALFQAEGMIERFEQGEFVEVVVRDQKIEPFVSWHDGMECVRSQMIHWRDARTNMEVARLHRFLRADGTIGASGKPDPKRLAVGGKIHRLHPSRAECEACRALSAP